MLRNPVVHQRLALEQLGPRICVMGPSNSGKSTLADAIARARGLPAIHLDQLYHRPKTDWQPRPEAEFVGLHDNAILAPRWIMDGNYSVCLPRRLERATGLILLDVPTATSLWRYLRRSWFRRDRPGALEGGKDSVKWEMIHHIVMTTRTNRRRYRLMYAGLTLPKLRLATAREWERWYHSEGLDWYPSLDGDRTEL